MIKKINEMDALEFFEKLTTELHREFDGAWVIDIRFKSLGDKGFGYYHIETLSSTLRNLVIYPDSRSIRIYLDNDKDALEFHKSKYPQTFNKFESVLQEILDWYYENKLLNRLKDSD